MKRIAVVTAFALSLSAAAPLVIAAEHDSGHDHGTSVHDMDMKDMPTTTGVVRKIDKAQGKVTLAHERIENLNMDAMTMVFRVRDPAMLEGVKEGDKVTFHAERKDGALMVMHWKKQ